MTPATLCALVRAQVNAGRSSVPVLDPHFQELTRLLREPSIDSDTVVRTVEREPALVVSVLRRANSTAFMSQSRIRDLRAACVRLGNREVFAIAFEVLFEQHFKARQEPLQAWLRETWCNSFVASRIAGHLAQEIGATSPTDARLAVLMHNVGELITLHMLQCILGRRRNPVVPTPEAVAAACHMMHEEIGGRLLESWGMPESVVRLASSHHNPKAATQGRDATLRKLALASWTLAVEAGASYLVTPNVDPVDAIIDLGLPAERVPALVEMASQWTGAAPADKEAA